jgi:hypothetical protein
MKEQKRMDIGQGTPSRTCLEAASKYLEIGYDRDRSWIRELL